MKFNRALDYIPKLSMSTEELVKIVKNAKNYIIKSPQVIPPKNATPVIHIFNHEKEMLLKNAIESHDLIEMKKTLQKCFDEANEKAYDLEQFIDWHEIYALLSSILKLHHGNMNALHFESQNAYDYLKLSNNLAQMEERFSNILSIYMDQLKLLKNRLFNKEINEAMVYINKNYQNPLKLSDIATYVGMNESYVSRLFKKSLHINFVDYLNRVRVEKAKALLKDGQLSVAETAFQVGYQNESYFSRIFKAVEGISPKQYQKK
ncbi:MAG: helix-turn-helix transcriptional regulator [Vallitaleaceae bacterium]|nr:helix-turn-helix transcriptional regulator [Vallitaleaceae bacterium]